MRWKTKVPGYSNFKAAQRRCIYTKGSEYHRYGGRGIKFLFKSFDEFLAEVGPKPSPKHSIDRYPNPDGNYEPGNVRWATHKQQMETANTVRTDEWNRNQSIAQTRYDLPIEDLKKAYFDQGLSTDQIGDSYGCNGHTVRLRLIKGGCALRTTAQSNKLRLQIVLPIQEIKKAYFEKGLTLGDIARVYDCDPKTVRARLVEAGFVLRRGIGGLIGSRNTNHIRWHVNRGISKPDTCALCAAVLELKVAS